MTSEEGFGYVLPTGDFRLEGFSWELSGNDGTIVISPKRIIGYPQVPLEHNWIIVHIQSTAEYSEGESLSCGSCLEMPFSSVLEFRDNVQNLNERTPVRFGGLNHPTRIALTAKHASGSSWNIHFEFDHSHATLRLNFTTDQESLSRLREVINEFLMYVEATARDS